MDFAVILINFNIGAIEAPLLSFYFMPPEPLPYDRKEFFYKDRKHDTIAAGDVLAGGSSTPRWRDPCYRASPRRPPPSYYNRQNGGYYPQIYEEKNSWYGCTLSRSDAVHRQTNSRYNRGWQGSGSRDGRGSLPWSPYHEPYSPTSPAIIRQISSPLPLFNKASPSRSTEIENRGSDVMSWKALKWSGEKRKSDRSENEIPQSIKLENPGVVCATDTEVASVDEEKPKKKSRLTWGQGLAKYEKQKVVEGSSNNSVSELSAKVAGSMSPETPCSAPPCVSSGANEVNRQPFSKAGNVVTDRQPFSKSTDSGKEESHQPLSKSAYMDSDVSDQPFINISNFDSDDNHYCQESLLSPKNCSEQFPIKLDPLPSTSELTSLLDDLLQPEEACTGDSRPNKYIATNKLEVLKVKIPKELEKTEYEIDLLENELKSLNSERENHIVPYSSPKIESFSEHDSGSANVAVPLNACNVDKLSKESPNETFSVENECVVRHTNEVSHTASNVKEVSEVIEESIVSADNLHTGSNKTDEVNFKDLIMASNKDAVKNALQEFDRFMPTKQQKIDIWESDFILACRKNDIHIKEKLAARKKELKIKEKVLAMKFKALHQIWKEDLHLLSVKKQRPKTQKCTEFCSSSLYSTRKHQVSVLSRFTSPGDLALVPPKNIEELTISSKLVDTHAKPYRPYLKMPALILDESDRKFSKFMSNNNLIEDPLLSEKERAIINPWTQEEKKIFMEMLSEYGKDFSKISSFLSHKTTADCIEFYYKNHKFESFSDVRKLRDKQKQSQIVPANTYMLTSGSKKWNADSIAASPGTAGNSPRNQPTSLRRKVSRTSFSSIEISGHEKENEVANSCVTSTISPSEKMTTTTDTNQTIEEEEEEEDTCSGEEMETYSVDWTDSEKSLFVTAFNLHGKDFAKISQCVETKSTEQCRIFFSKARKSLGLDSIKTSDTDESVSNTLQKDFELPSQTEKQVNDVKVTVEEAQATTDETETKIEVEGSTSMANGTFSLPQMLLSCSQKKPKHENVFPSFNFNLNCHTDQTSQLISSFPLNENHFSNIYVSGTQFDRNGFEKQCNGTGNVKIFGQILKVESSSKLESFKQSNLEDIPIQKSYGFWDGTQIKTGFASLPESIISAAAAASHSQQVSGFQPRSAMNFVNGPGISDPVAALKLAKLYNGVDLNGR